MEIYSTSLNHLLDLHGGIFICVCAYNALFFYEIYDIYEIYDRESFTVAIQLPLKSHESISIQ